MVNILGFGKPKVSVANIQPCCFALKAVMHAWESECGCKALLNFIDKNKLWPDLARGS